MNCQENRPRIIYSRNNVRIRRIRDLQRREERERTGCCFIDGIRFVFQAVERGVKIETLLLAPELLVHPTGKRLARQLRREGTPILEVPKEVYHSVSLAEEPQGIGAVMRQQWSTLEQIRPEDGLCWLVLDTVQSAGNLGTIIRTSEAVGGAGIVLLDSHADIYDPATIRASMGAVFGQKFVRTPLAAFADWKRKHGCHLIGTSPSACTDYRAVQYAPPVALFMGGERKGLPAEYQQLCDSMVRIPMVGRSDSLNLAVASSVLLYEVFGQRHGVGEAVRQVGCAQSVTG